VLDSRVYEVYLPDGHIKEYAANALAKNIYSQVDAEGFRHLDGNYKFNGRMAQPHGSHYAI
jgi:hypothetical protein